jgi:putative membrane protein
MITYRKTDWIKAIWYFHTGGTIIALLKRLLIVLVYVSFVTIFEISYLHQRLTNTPTEFFSALGILLSLLLIFRTNTAYDRFYEGRTAWGSLVNNCRNLAIAIDAILPAERQSERFFFTKTIANFPFALKNHLRDNRVIEELEVNDGFEEIKRFDHLPNAVVMQMRKRVEGLYREGVITDAQLINLNDMLITFLNVAGICERIKSTPIPFSYSFFIKLFILIFVTLLPFSILEVYGYITIPAVLIMSYVLIGLEMIGEEIEEPFGTEQNDLPLDQISRNIRINVHEIFNVALPKQDKAPQRNFTIVT